MTELAGRPEVFRALLVVGALLVAVLAMALRRLRRRAELDEAEEVLRTEIEHYDRDWRQRERLASRRRTPLKSKDQSLR